MNPKKETYKKLADTIIKNLNKRNMEGYYCGTSAEAIQLAMSMIPEGSSVSFGGSMTFVETGMYDALKASNLNLLDRNLAKTPEEKRQSFIDSITSNYFFMSSNAITIDINLSSIDGRELINIDETEIAYMPDSRT